MFKKNVSAKTTFILGKRARARVVKVSPRQHRLQAPSIVVWPEQTIYFFFRRQNFTISPRMLDWTEITHIKICIDQKTSKDRDKWRRGGKGEDKRRDGESFVRGDRWQGERITRWPEKVKADACSCQAPVLWVMQHHDLLCLDKQFHRNIVCRVWPTATQASTLV